MKNLNSQSQKQNQIVKDLGSILGTTSADQNKDGPKEKNRTFKTRNFLILNDLLKIKKTSLPFSMFLVSFTFMNLLITNMHTYLDQLTHNYNIQTTSSSFQVMSSLSYLDIQKVLTIANWIYLSLFALSIALSVFLVLLYALCYIDKLMNPDIHPRKYFFGRWFVNLSEYFSWICFFPFVIIMLSYILCNRDVLEEVNISCESSTLRSIGITAATIGIICAVVGEWSLSLFFQNDSSNQKDYLNCNNEMFLVYFNFFRLTVGIVATVRIYTYEWLIFSIFYNLVASWSIMIYIIFMKGVLAFRNNRLRTLITYLIVFYTSQSTAFLLDEICRIIKIFGDNFEGAFNFTLACYLMLGLSVYYLSLKQQEILLIDSNIQQMDPVELQKKIFFLILLNDRCAQDKYDDNFFKGIIQNHLRTECQYPHEHQLGRCFCKMRGVYDPKKRKEEPLATCFRHDKRTIFTQFMIKSWYQTYLSAHPTDINVVISYAHFLYNQLQMSALALINLESLQSKFIYPLQAFKIFNLKRAILKGTQKKNRAAYRKKLEIESVIPIENQISMIKQLIQNIFRNNILFWDLLTKNQISLDECNDVLKSTFEQIGILQELWINIMKYLEYRKQWKFYYVWYILYVLNKKVKVALMEKFVGVNINENDIFSQELQQENADDDMNSVNTNMRHEEFEKNENIQSVQMVFDKNSCVIHSDSSYEGRILKVNNPVYQAFKLTLEDIRYGMNITQLMPRVFSKLHPTIMKTYMEIGKSKGLYSQRKVFCLNKDGDLFAAWKFVKQFITYSGKAEYVALLRPIKQPIGSKSYYLIVNKDWEIEAMCQELHQVFNIASIDYHNPAKRLLLNLLCIAPPLIQYTKFNKFLDNLNMRKLNLISVKERSQTIRLGARQASLGSPDAGKVKFAKTQNKQTGDIIIINADEQNQNQDGSESSPKATHGLQPSLKKKINHIVHQQSIDSVGPDVQSLNRQGSSSDDSFTINQMKSMNSEQGVGLNLDEIDIIKSNNNGEPGNSGQLQNSNSSYQYEEDKEDYDIDDQKDAYQEINQNLKTLKYGTTAIDQEVLQMEAIKMAEKREAERNGDTEIENEDLEDFDQQEEFLDSDLENQQDQIDDQRDTRLQRGIPVQFWLQVPFDIYDFAQYYQGQLSNQLRNFELDNKNSNSMGMSYAYTGAFRATMAGNLTVHNATSTMAVGANNPNTSQAAQSPEHMRDENYGKFFRRQKSETYQVVCQAKFKKYGNERIGMIQITSLDRLGSNSEAVQTQIQSLRESSFVEQRNSITELQPMTSFLQPSLSYNPSQNSSQGPSGQASQTPEEDEHIDLTKQNGLGYLLQNNIQDREAGNLHKDFKNRYGAQSFSLNSTDNIYLKEENHKAKKTLSNISSLKWILRSFFLMILGLNIFTFLMVPFQDFDTLRNQSFRIFQSKQTLLVMLESYSSALSVVMVNSENFSSEIIQQSPYQTKEIYLESLHSNFQSKQAYFRSLNTDENMKKTLMDASLNRYDILERQIIDIDESNFVQASTEFQSNINTYPLDNFDLYLSFVLNINQIADLQTLDGLNIESTQVRFFRQNIFPALNNMFEDSQTKLLDTLNETVADMEQILIIILIIDSCIMVVSIVMLLVRMQFISDSFHAVIHVFTDIHVQDVQKIKSYNVFLLESFNYLTFRDDCLNGKPVEVEGDTQNETAHIRPANINLEQAQDQTNTMGKQKQTVIQGNFLWKIQLAVIIYYLIFICVISTITLVFHFTIKGTTDSIQLFMENGQQVINPATLNIVMQIAIKQQTLDLQNYDDYLFPILENQIKYFVNMKKDISISDMSFSNFDQAFETIFRQNPCINHSDLIGKAEEIEDCKKVSIGSFSHGLTTFNSYFSNQIKDFLYHEDSQFGQISSTDIFDFERANYYGDIFVVFLMNIWSSDIISYLDSQFFFLIIYISSSIFVLLIVFLIISQILLLGRFQQQYQYFRTVFQMFIPEAILFKDQRIQYWLVKHDVISK